MMTFAYPSVCYLLYDVTSTLYPPTNAYWKGKKYVGIILLLKECCIVIIKIKIKLPKFRQLYGTA
jgi:hypothetical protein